MTRRWPHAGALVVCFLMVSAQVPWRPDVLYEGGADPVVLAKGALTILALCIGIFVVRSRGHRFDVPAAPFLWVFGFLACTVLGAAADGRLVPTLVLAVRAVLVLLIVAVLMSTYRPQDVLHAVVVVFGILVVAATLTTLVLGSTGRLRGGLPPLHANELASLAVMCLLWVVARLFRGEDRPASVLFVPACAAIIILTESRTSLAAGAASLVVLVLFATRMRPVVAGIVAAVPALVLGLVVLTSALGQAVTRGEDAARLATFANRLYAWQAAVAPGQAVWHVWFGGGLSQKTVQVIGQPWTEQVLDSSWVSALVQAGWAGLAVGICWVVSILLALFRAPRDWRGSRWHSSSSSSCAASSRAACSTPAPRSSCSAPWPSRRSSCADTPPSTRTSRRWSAAPPSSRPIDARPSRRATSARRVPRAGRRAPRRRHGPPGRTNRPRTGSARTPRRALRCRGEGFVVEKPLDRIGHGRGVPGRDQQSGLPLDDALPVPEGVRSNDARRASWPSTTALPKGSRSEGISTISAAARHGHTGLW